MKTTQKRTYSNKSQRERIFQISGAVSRRLCDLATSWHNEKKNANWKDYVKALKQLTPPDATFVKASKVPFGFTIRLNENNGLYRFFSKPTVSGWDRATRHAVR